MKNIKLIITMTIIACFVLIGISYSFFYCFMLQVKSDESSLNSSLMTSEKNKQRNKKENEVMVEMHRMANTKIIAIDEQIWGEEDMSQNNINKLLLIVSKSNFKEKYSLLIILNRWKKGDFSRIVEDHNYVWGLLGGTIGRAVKGR